MNVGVTDLKIQMSHLISDGSANGIKAPQTPQLHVVWERRHALLPVTHVQQACCIPYEEEGSEEAAQDTHSTHGDQGNQGG